MLVLSWSMVEKSKQTHSNFSPFHCFEWKGRWKYKAIYMDLLQWVGVSVSSVWFKILVLRSVPKLLLEVYVEVKSQHWDIGCFFFFTCPHLHLDSFLLQLFLEEILWTAHFITGASIFWQLFKWESFIFY